MADLDALQALPTELQLKVLGMDNMQTVCRFSQVNQRAKTLVDSLIGIEDARRIFAHEVAERQPSRTSAPSLATSDVWCYDMIAATTLPQPICDQT
ncbi:hypothetical protein PG994_005045 [Apiospora phragmitis]|uniref:F-box domain-containing protein n=1 Tax=Apiospora phragmitis TaxID=2905665 RepID=A0ABR1VSA8_9PEZI